MNLVPRYDDPRPKTLKVTARTRKSLQTDGRTTPYHNTHQRQAYRKEMKGRTTPYHNTHQRRAYKKEINEGIRHKRILLQTLWHITDSYLLAEKLDDFQFFNIVFLKHKNSTEYVSPEYYFHLNSALTHNKISK